MTMISAQPNLQKMDFSPEILLGSECRPLSCPRRIFGPLWSRGLSGGNRRCRGHSTSRSGDLRTCRELHCTRHTLNTKLTESNFIVQFH